MRLTGTFVVKSVEEVDGKFAAGLVRRAGLGNLRIVLDEEVEEGDEFEFVLRSD
ncbi:MAG: hypothetical protein MAG715_00759 [Methanonatronarchaeales archaeon]|nr:hypothetical protein [Methanonatronarchaeales archaeon]